MSQRLAIPIHCSGNSTSDKGHCGDAPDAAEAMRGIRASKPDVVIVAISLAGASGIDLIKDFKAEFEDSPVLVVSMQAESLYAERALRSGAMGYVMLAFIARLFVRPRRGPSPIKYGVEWRT